ncbi:MAG: site-specific DNA-methyltransferase [Anaerolineales bacterium]
MSGSEIHLDSILQGDCIEIMQALPEQCVDLVFADPPYNLQLNQELWRPNMTRVDGVEDDWDRFESFEAYDDFTRAWLQACKHVLKDTGTLWVIGTYHNIFRIGAILQDLDFWILNDVIWVKTNPMPNFRGVRLTNAHETMIWALKQRGAKYTFNHHALKAFNDGKQMRSDWLLPLCTGAERLQVDGKKLHATQKPEALIYRLLLASSHPGDVVLDPFFGTGTTGAVAKRLHRHWIGIEREERYVKAAQERIDGVEVEELDEFVFDTRDKRRLAPRVSMARLLEQDLLRPGQVLYFRKDRRKYARLKPDGKLIINDAEGSIHQIGKRLMGGAPCNGWTHWYYEQSDGSLHPIDDLREEYRRRFLREADNPTKQ